MKLLGFVLGLGVVPIVHVACTQVTGGGGRTSAVRPGITRFAEEDISDVGTTGVHAIAHGEEQIEANLIGRLEGDGQTTGETPRPLRPCRNVEHPPGARGLLGLQGLEPT